MLRPLSCVSVTQPPSYANLENQGSFFSQASSQPPPYASLENQGSFFSQASSQPPPYASLENQGSFFSQASSYASFLDKLVGYKPKAWSRIFKKKMDEQTTLTEIYTGISQQSTRSFEPRFNISQLVNQVKRNNDKKQYRFATRFTQVIDLVNSHFQRNEPRHRPLLSQLEELVFPNTVEQEEAVAVVGAPDRCFTTCVHCIRRHRGNRRRSC